MLLLLLACTPTVDKDDADPPSDTAADSGQDTGADTDTAVDTSETADTDTGVETGQDTAIDTSTETGEDSGQETGVETGAETGAETGDTAVADWTCVDGDLFSALGDAVASGTLTGAEGDDQAGSCGGTGGADVAYLWTAPSDARYAFSTEGSDYDTVLRVFSECGGAEIECDDDGGSSVDSVVELDVIAGTALLLVVDAYSSGYTGGWVLNIAEAVPDVCPDGDLGSATGDAVASGSNVGATDSLTSSCATLGADVTWTWTAPADGTYTFDSLGSDFDTLLTLYTGGCAGTELICDDDIGSMPVDTGDTGMGSAYSYESRVEQALVAGDVVLVGLGGYGGAEGNYVLNIAGP